jgi:hypothetical protein
MLQNPFDDDMNVTMPEPPRLDGEEAVKYTNWPSAEGYETVPADWKPKAGRELPALRCTHVRDDDSRCKNFGVRGTGFNGTPSMCFIHGGSLPNVKAKAEATLLVARMRLVENTGMALDTLFALTKPGTADNIRLKASTEILDRAGIKGGFDVNVEVQASQSMAEDIGKKLEIMRQRQITAEKEAAEAEQALIDEGEYEEDIVDEPEESSTATSPRQEI